MPNNPDQILRQLRDSIDRLESGLGAAPDEGTLEQSIREASEVVRKLKGLRQARDEQAAANHGTFAFPASKRDESDAGQASTNLQKREYVLLGLEEIGQPASPAFISTLIKKRWNVDVAPTQFASIRKGDERAWLRGRRTRPFIVPALNAFDLSARPRTCAVSTWNAERRVIGSLSERVDALSILLRAAQRAQGKHGEAWRWAITSIARDFNLGGASRDPTAIVKAAKEALGSIVDKDRKDRESAAQRLGHLSEKWQLFGRPLSYDVVEGGKNA